MSTLFFDGFDRGYLLKKLDPNYWTTQLKNYPKYSFGAWTYDNSTVNNQQYTLSFQSYGDSDTIKPSAQDILFAFSAINFRGTANANNTIPAYPGFGKAPGFLALNHIPINNSEFNFTPITYLQLSGFPQISGSSSYFGIRCLGIETKDSTVNDLAQGRFGNKHPFLAFCSGNTTGLLLSFVKVTGNNLLNLNMKNDPIANFSGPKMTIGIQVEQHNEILGVFDANVSDTISNYMISPVYCDPVNRLFESSINNGIPIELLNNVNNNFKVLTIADSKFGGTYQYLYANSFFTHENRKRRRVISRWTHFEIGINHSGSLQIKIEDADALLIDNNNERESWDIILPISGFYYDNIKIFNRTYNSSILTDQCGDSELEYNGVELDEPNTSYYLEGSVTLIDDVTLIDNTGTGPTFFLGRDSKVLPLNPGFGTNNSQMFSDSNTSYDGPRAWTKTPLNLSNKAILASFDGDISKISSFVPNSININVYSNNYANNFDLGNSRWRYDYNDTIAGMKVYNWARKEFLDTSFINIVSKKDYINNDLSVKYLYHFDEEDKIIDYSFPNNQLDAVGNIEQINDSKFNSGIKLNKNGFLVINDNYNIGSGQFTLESWIKFDTNEDEIFLFDKKYQPLNSHPLSGTQGMAPFMQQDPQSYTMKTDFFTIRPSLFAYSLSVNTGSVFIKSFYISATLNGTSLTQPLLECSSTLELILPSAIQTGIWNHLAITRTNINNSGYFNVFLNGVSGSQYVSKDINHNISFNGNFNTNSFLNYSNCPGTGFISGNSPGIFRYIPSWDSWTNTINDSFGAHFGILDSFYWQNNNTRTSLPYAYIHGKGSIDEYRFVSGVVRYSSNFTPPNQPFTGVLDGFIQIGPEHNLNRTIYKPFQFYQMNRPDTNEPFDITELNNGFRLGVKKI